MLIAGVISRLLDDGDIDMFDGVGGIDKLARQLCITFALHNKKFDCEKFLFACGLDYEL